MNLLNSYLFGAPVVTDPYFANVSLLLHMQGANNGTSFPDNSANAFTVTPVGNAKTSTAAYKWGSASGLFDGSGDYLSVPASSKFDFGTGDFTIEFWYRPNGGAGAYQYFFDIGSNGTALRLYNLNTFLAYVGGAVNVSVTLGTPLTVGTWYYISFVRSVNSFTLYLNSVFQGTFTDTRAAGSSSLGLRVAGTALGDFPVNGYMQDFRVTKGIARPNIIPTAQFPDS